MKKIEYINAGAGSGKTYRLTHQLAEYLCEPDPKKRIEPSQVIVTTFTKKAAEEIKVRARQVLLEKGLTEQAAQLDSAAIGTTHSVAQMLVNRYWYALKASPNQAVITDQDKRIYQNQSLAQMLEGNAYQMERAAIERYYREFKPTKREDGKTKDDSELWIDHLQRVVGKITYYGIGENELKESIERSEKLIDMYFCNDSAISEKTYQDFRNKLIEDAKAFMEEKRGKDGNYQVGRLKFYKTVLYSGSKPLYHILLSLYSAVSGKDVKSLANLDYYQQTLRRWLQSSYYGSIVKGCLHAIFSLAQAWTELYKNFKLQHGVIDYDDMEKGLLKLVEDPAIGKEIASTYKLLMVDEFQDCNPMQLKIFAKISDLIASGSPLDQSTVWVGDPKQAIYGFRGSDTELINRVAAKFPEELRKPDENGLMRDILDKSFRSRADLVNLVNTLFSKEGLFPEMTPLSAELGEIGGQEPAFREWNILDDAADMHYASLAKRIREEVEKGTTQIRIKDNEGCLEMRPLKYQDIAILVRTNAELKKTVEALRNECLPVSAPETEFLDRAEIQFVMALLNLTERKHQPHEWATLKRLWTDASTEEVLSDRLQYIKAHPELCERNTEAEDTWLEQEESLLPLRTVIKEVKSRNLTLSQRLTAFVLELGLNDYIQKWGDENERRQNLQTLQSEAVKFEQRCDRLNIHASVREFYKYLDEATIEPAKDTDSDTIKVLTYHGSKGLEWPMVILESLGNNELEVSSLVTREYWGVHEVQKDCNEGELFPRYQLLYFPAPSNHNEELCTNEAIDQALLESARQRTQGENARLLYVGITRARDYIVLASGPNRDFTWIDNIGLSIDEFNAATEPIEANVAHKPRSSKEQQALEHYNQSKQAWEERLASLHILKNYGLRKLAPLSEDHSSTKFLKPSQMPAEKDKAVGKSYSLIEIRKEKVSVNLKLNEEGQVPKGWKSVFGTCIHNIFAACPFDGTKPTQAQRKAYLEIAKAILDNYGLIENVPEPGQLVDALQSLYDWLTAEYGPATRGIVHEYPFVFLHNDNQVVRGEMDLIWQTDKGDVIVDFKNFMGEPELVVTPDNEHFVGHNYVPQLHAYRRILEEAHHTVLDSVLYYDILGQVVKV